MKFKTLFAPILLAAVLIGCVTPQKTVYEDPPGSGSYTTNTAYAPDPRLVEAVDKAKQVHDSLDPLNPYAPLTRPLVDGVGALLIAGAGLLAAFKNRQANNTKAALKTVVEGVEAMGVAADAVKVSIGTVAANKGTGAVTKKAVTEAKL